MDQELKQRLIGASVIIALAIIFIPMLFDNEVDKSGDKKIDIVIPESGSHQLSVKTFSLEDESLKDESPNKEPADVTVPETELTLSDDQVMPRDAQEPVDGNGLIESSKQVAENNIEDTTKEQQETKPEEISSEPVTETDSEETNTRVENTDSQQQAKESNASSDSKPEAVPVGQTIFRVKLGSFSKADNAQQVKNKLAQQGIDSLVELAPDKALYRVWSQALYRDKAKAEDYVDAVNKLKLNIGTPKIITVTEDEVKASADRGQLGWVVQLGSFAAKNNALDLRNKLKLAGFSAAFVDQSKNSQGESRYRLRVGPVNTREQATQLKQQISEKLKLNGLVKTHELAQLVD